ncbi:hypothetical protein BDN72DRAFT_835356 [Pluteus cervinus]|uniref:Uncharacterized protein n=1 Tax=Pluteus cervinus TaxID=181527 RepID=A0ACD3B4N7_9AGAR|nr:hypothetical protein BDN72DRAFT_835356 [Pluteus cervinus]
MAARKLQTEIDRTLKKVAEGVDLFESIYEKMQASTNQTQKEKLELDLKTQIKKLQRLRDQIKTWVASNDIKDKSLLLENRRLIETQMEKFKACEKEMKTKAFSKEGLIQATKLDPKEQEKEEATSWLQTQVEELQMQVESTEAEIEGLQGTGKKRGKGTTTAAGRLEELESLNDRRKWHISRLEIILRLLNNGSMSPDKVFALKEDVQYFVESNMDETYEEDEGIYDDLNLDEEEEKFGLAINEDDDSEESDEASEDLPPRTPSKKHDEESVTSSKRDDSPILKKAGVALTMRKASVDTKPPNINFVQQPMASVVKASAQPVPRTPVTLPPIRYAAAAAAGITSSAPHPPQSSAVASSTPSATTGAAPPTSTPSIPPLTPQIAAALPTQDQMSSSSPSLTHQSTTSPILSSASESHKPDGSFYSGQPSPALSEALQAAGAPVATSPQRTTASRKDSAAPSPKLAAQTMLQDLQPVSNGQVNGGSTTQPAPSPLPQQLHQYPGTPNVPSTPAFAGTIGQQPQFPPGVKVPQAEQATLQQQQQAAAAGLAQQRPSSSVSNQAPGRQSTPSAFPGSLQDLVVAFENVKQKAPLRMNNLDQVHKMLEGGYSSIPQPRDTENRPKFYSPRNPYQTALYYPQEPLPLLSTTTLFSQLDVETLFYVFYFLPGTYQQFLAAKELKRQSWRFHVKYLTWFQRHSEPQAITEDYEQGVYVYFDWEGSWCQRKKSDFRFEYRYLSED